jgi:LysM repeat protein
MLHLFRVSGAATVDDVQISDGKIIAEGVITTDILYVPTSDEAPLAAQRATLPFRQVIEAAGATSAMDVHLHATVSQTTFNMLSPREAEVRFNLTFAARVTCTEEVHVIGDIAFEDTCPDTLAARPSMTIYVVQPGDTLWSIAKNAGTPIDEITTVNDIDALPTPGQKLLLLKR